ncbi:hypothetical protein PXH67_16910 [Streptomyces sp. P8-A8]|uniref:hypothetical protein n=1 Tax=Streptomyces sp. P8-A8 TaxID=3029759 RepID=UPI0036D7D1D8
MTTGMSRRTLLMSAAALAAAGPLAATTTARAAARTPKVLVIGLAYTTHYRQEAPQKGEVLVSYDKDTPAVVKTYTADTVSKTESLTLQVPAGATTAQVRFRYTGGNNWFWAVDGVTLTPA